MSLKMPEIGTENCQWAETAKGTMRRDFDAEVFLSEHKDLQPVAQEILTMLRNEFKEAEIVVSVASDTESGFPRLRYDVRLAGKAEDLLPVFYRTLRERMPDAAREMRDRFAFTMATIAA